MNIDPNSVAHIFAISLTPAFLLAGTGALLGVISSRMTSAIEKARTLNRETKRTGAQESFAFEIKAVDRDCLLLNYSLILATTSAFFTSLVITTLFCGQLISFGYSAEVLSTIFFAAATLCLSASIFLLFCSMQNGKRLLFAITKLGDE